MVEPYEPSMTYIEYGHGHGHVLVVVHVLSGVMDSPREDLSVRVRVLLFYSVPKITIASQAVCTNPCQGSVVQQVASGETVAQSLQ